MNYSKGISWFDDCRIPFLQDEGYEYKNGPRGNSFSIGQEPDGKRTEPVKSNTKGRFPANILCSDDVLNDGSMGGSAYCDKTFYDNEYDTITLGKMNRYKTGYGDKGTNSRYYDIDKWFDNLINNI